jgi:hypothetical protein
MAADVRRDARSVGHTFLQNRSTIRHLRTSHIPTYAPPLAG